MSGTIDQNFCPLLLEKDDKYLSLRFPAHWYNNITLMNAFAALSGEITFDIRETEENTKTLYLKVNNMRRHVDDIMTRVFSKIANVPLFSCDVSSCLCQERDPFLSVIIVLTANDLFVSRHLIPSIVDSTRTTPFEIIIVYNGKGANLELFGKCKVVTSEYGCVSKAYNAGAKEAKGNVLAFFHDDCLLNDRTWLQQCIALLDGTVMAVTPEVDRRMRPFVVAKCVPLVMYKEDFFRMGGFDETYYCGIEDVGFTYQMLSGGYRIK